MTERQLLDYAKTELNLFLDHTRTVEANIGFLCRHGHIDG